MLQVCPNGEREPGAHPSLPVEPAAVAAIVAEAYALGVQDAHVHAKDASGKDSMDPDDVAAVVEAVRAAAPGKPIGVRTSEWVVADPRKRAELIEAWEVLPDHATINWHESGAEQVARALLDRGVGVHAGIYTGTEGVSRFLNSGLAADIERVLIEITEADYVRGLTHAERIRDDVRGMGAAVTLHGMDSIAWDALKLAARLGVDARIGLEDTLYLPDGSVAPDNAALVRAALDLMR